MEIQIQSRGINGYFVSLPSANSRSNNSFAITKLLPDGLIAHFSLAQLYNFVPDVLLQHFCLAYSVTFEWKKDIMWMGVF